MLGCKEYLYTNSSHCHLCGAPITDPAVRSLRYLNYLCRELEQHEESGLLTLRQAHDFASDVKERIAALKRKLERDRAPFVLPVEEGPQSRRRRRRRHEAESVEEEAPRPRVRRWAGAACGVPLIRVWDETCESQS
jgi:hypothetical protein